MKIALAQINTTVGDFEVNKTKIIEYINKAKSQDAKLVVFGEQVISGAPAYDLLNKVDFLDLCEDALVEIASYCDNISVLVGLPVQFDNKTISVAALIENRHVVRYIGKKNVVSRDELYNISPSKGCEYVKIAGKKVAVLVGEDIHEEQQYGEYADIIVNLTNWPYARAIVEKRYDFYKQLGYMTGKPVLYVNNVGASTDVVYDGSSAVFDSRGNAIALLKNFEEDLQIIDVDADNQPIPLVYQNKTVNVYRAIKLGLGDYFCKNGFKTACLGLSGGIDSAVVLALAAEVLGAENVRVLLMPSQYSTDHSVEDAVHLAENLGVKYDIAPITEPFKAVTSVLNDVFEDKEFGITDENIQSRLRGAYIMALSNKYGYIVLNTSNKSETAVGYGTLYGDTIGALSIIGDLYKSEVYDLARHINRKGDIIPENTITKEPSAELRPDQKDSDSLPPYDVIDAILYRMIEEGQSREEIINSGFEADDVYKVYGLVVHNEYKRYQSCPTLRMSTRTLSKGRIMPLTSKYGR